MDRCVGRVRCFHVRADRRALQGLPILGGLLARLPGGGRRDAQAPFRSPTGPGGTSPARRPVYVCPGRSTRPPHRLALPDWKQSHLRRNYDGSPLTGVTSCLGLALGGLHRLLPGLPRRKWSGSTRREVALEHCDALPPLGHPCQTADVPARIGGHHPDLDRRSLESAACPRARPRAFRDCRTRSSSPTSLRRQPTDRWATGWPWGPFSMSSGSTS